MSPKMVLEVTHGVVWYSVAQKVMESRANHYFDIPQRQNIKFTIFGVKT